jgi:hypothetical protein
MIPCNHFFCLMPARAYSRGVASYKVTQHLPAGDKVTYVCTDDMAAMSKVLKDTDIVEVL